MLRTLCLLACFSLCGQICLEAQPSNSARQQRLEYLRSRRSPEARKQYLESLQQKKETGDNEAILAKAQQHPRGEWGYYYDALRAGDRENAKKWYEAKSGRKISEDNLERKILDAQKRAMLSKQTRLVHVPSIKIYYLELLQQGNVEKIRAFESEQGWAPLTNAELQQAMQNSRAGRYRPSEREETLARDRKMQFCYGKLLRDGNVAAIRQMEKDYGWREMPYKELMVKIRNEQRKAEVPKKDTLEFDGIWWKTCEDPKLAAVFQQALKTGRRDLIRHLEKEYHLTPLSEDELTQLIHKAN